MDKAIIERCNAAAAASPESVTIASLQMSHHHRFQQAAFLHECMALSVLICGRDRPVGARLALVVTDAAGGQFVRATLGEEPSPPTAGH